MQPFKTLISLIILPLITCASISTNTLLAESATNKLTNCNGTWTNLPCDKDIVTEIDETSHSAGAPIDSTVKIKDELVHELAMTRYRIQRDYDLKVSTVVVEKQCALPETTVEKCAALISEKEKELLELAKIRSQELAAQQKANENQENIPLVTTIIQFNEADRYWRDRWRKTRKRTEPEEPKELDRDKPYYADIRGRPIRNATDRTLEHRDFGR
jgi:hypothetical protein